MENTLTSHKQAWIYKTIHTLFHSDDTASLKTLWHDASHAWQPKVAINKLWHML